MKGKVYLVGGGPGDPELLTLKAAKILGRANIVLHDALVSREVLALAAAGAERIDVGKRCGTKLLTQEEINALMISYAKSHKVVVRLKGGDPLFFGRAGEEIAALREAGVEFEIVPGITAGFAAAAAARFSLTDRRVASQVLFTTIQRNFQQHDASDLHAGDRLRSCEAAVARCRMAGGHALRDCVACVRKRSGDSFDDTGEAGRRSHAAGPGDYGSGARGGGSGGRDRPGISDRRGKC